MKSQVKSERIRILFFSEAVTLAHLVRPLILASIANTEQTEVAIASANSYPFIWDYFSFKKLPLKSRAPAEFEQVLMSGDILFDEERITEYVKEELCIIESFQPDIIIGDLRPSLSVSAKVSGVPYINLTNAYWSPFSTVKSFPPPCSKVLAERLPKGRLGDLLIKILTIAGKKKAGSIQFEQGRGLNAVRKKYGLVQFDNYLTSLTDGDLTLYLDLPSVVSTETLPTNHLYLGPIFWSPPINTPSWWNKALQQPPIIYVSLGSSGWHNLVPMIVETLLSMGLTVILGSFNNNSILPSSPRLFSAPLLPGHLVSKIADLVICNGGSPTAYQAFSSGVPIIGIPANMDQLLFMQHVTLKELGLAIRADTIDRLGLKKVVKKILSDSKFRRNATQIMSQMQNLDTKDVFNKLIMKTKGEYEYNRVCNL